MISVFSSKARLLVAGLGLALAGLLGGCVSQGEYDRLYETNNSLTARNTELTTKLNELQAQNDLMKKSMGSGEGAVMALQKRNAELEALLDKAMKDYRDLGESMAGLNFGPVNPETDKALAALAAQYPDLIKYDSARGMLRFASDLTFDSGSAVVKSNAASAIEALSKILTSSAASSYQVVVEGHTDSQKIANPATLKNHPTNRYLSAHRAISVIDQLGKEGVASDRMLAAGWGEYKPAVPNNANGNTPANRRVEIFLAKMSTDNPTETSAAAKPTTKPTKTTKVDDIDITK